VAMRARKPNCCFRVRLEGWKVRLLMAWALLEI